MSNNRCANCGKGKIQFQNVKDFETKVRGVPFTVPEATVGICNSCGAKLFSPQEIRRWHQLFDAQQLRTGRLLSAEEIGSIRQGLGLPINLFAQLLGTTRQSVYNWERKDRKSPQMRLVDLLLKLVRESGATGTVDVLQFLSEQTGVELNGLNHTPTSIPSRRLIRRDPRRRWRNPCEYDRVFGSHGIPIALPSLRNF
jgi:putative zinc finger/helix-turn-helix YgiT family protein